MRRADWEARLRAVLAQWRQRPFSWDGADCGCLAADAIMAVVDVPDPMAELRGRYDSAISNAKALLSLGFRSPEDFMASKFADVAPALARRGDIGVVEMEGTRPLVVVAGHTLVGPGDSGTVSLPRALLLRAFRIGW